MYPVFSTACFTSCAVKPNCMSEDPIRLKEMGFKLDINSKPFVIVVLFSLSYASEGVLRSFRENIVCHLYELLPKL